MIDQSKTGSSSQIDHRSAALRDAEYVTLAKKWFLPLHPSLVFPLFFSFFSTPPIKQKPGGLQIGERLLIASKPPGPIIMIRQSERNWEQQSDQSVSISSVSLEMQSLLVCDPGAQKIFLTSSKFKFFSFFQTPPIKLKPGLQKGGRLLIAS